MRLFRPCLASLLCLTLLAALRPAPPARAAVAARLLRGLGAASVGLPLG